MKYPLDIGDSDGKNFQTQYSYIYFMCTKMNDVTLLLLNVSHFKTYH